MAFVLQKVLISDNVSPKCSEYFKDHGIEVDTKTKLTKEQLIKEIPNYDGLIVRSATKVTADVIAAASSLKIIGRAGTGVDNIDIPAATKKGIVVMNTPGGNTLSAVEHTCAMVACLARHIPQAHRSLKEGRWDRKVYMGTELAGKTLAIIGLGRIGREVATRMQSYEMTTIGFDPLVPADEAKEFGVEWLPVEEIWPRADYITVHVPLIQQTKGLVGEKSFPLCKKGVKVVNVARGGVVDEAALVTALESGQCGGAALDVYTEEPPTNEALIQHPKVICTPHLGASTEEAQVRVALEIAEQMVDAVKGKRLFGAINAGALGQALKPETRAVVSLGVALGILLTGLSSKPPQEVTVVTCGAGMASASYVGDAVTAGVLKTRATSPLNLVNASLYAKELGVTVTRNHEDGPRDLVKVTAGSVTLVGQAQGSHPVLLEAMGQSFGAGVGLVGSLVFFASNEPLKHLAELSGCLSKDNQVMAFATTTASTNKWNVTKLAQSVSDLGGFEKRVCSFFATF